jgi:hypothetical protein
MKVTILHSGAIRFAADPKAKWEGLDLKDATLIVAKNPTHRGIVQAIEELVRRRYRETSCRLTKTRRVFTLEKRCTDVAHD